MLCLLMGSNTAQFPGFPATGKGTDNIMIDTRYAVLVGIFLLVDSMEWYFLTIYFQLGDESSYRRNMRVFTAMRTFSGFKRSTAPRASQSSQVALVQEKTTLRSVLCIPWILSFTCAYYLLRTLFDDWTNKNTEFYICPNLY